MPNQTLSRFSALQRAEIPQMYRHSNQSLTYHTFQCSSASRNSSNSVSVRASGTSTRFQCSSASRNSSNAPKRRRGQRRFGCFSALQRAEIPQRRLNPSPPRPRRAVSVLFSEPKFLKHRGSAPVSREHRRFSALQRAEIPQISR